MFDILLITRFSLNLGMHTSNLFDVDRLNFRLEIFSKITLLSIINQSFKDFKWIILYDKQLPLEILDKLKILIEPYNFIYLEEYTGWNKGYLNPYNKYLNNDYVITIRIDDDDGITKKFIENVYNKAKKFKNDFLLISHINGLYWSYSCNLDYGITIKKTYPFIGVGTALLVNRNLLPITIYFHDHSKILESLRMLRTYNKKNNKIYQTFISNKIELNKIEKILNKTISVQISSPNSFLRTFHSNNDSNFSKTVEYHLNKKDKKLNNDIYNNFGIREKDLSNINNLILNKINYSNKKIK